MRRFPQPLLDELTADPARIVFEHGERRVSAAELLATIRRMAGGLKAAGLRPASGVAMLTSTTPEAFAAYIAANTIGCRVVGIRPGYSQGQLEHMMKAGVDAVVTDGTIAQLNRSVPIDVCAGGRPNDAARLVYTSGSTGTPKGCVQTFRAMSAHWSWTPEMRDEDIDDLAACGERYLLSGTLASAVVQDFAALALMAGGTAVIPDHDEPLPYLVQRYRITGATVDVPRLYQFLDIERTDDVDTSSLKGMAVVGSPLPPQRLKEAYDRLGPVVYQAYGQSETGNLTMLTPRHLETYGPDVLSTVGRPHSHVDIAVRAGELVARTRYQMSGYWQDAEQTADVIAGDWVRTRDLGDLDPHGFVRLTGRARDVIIVNAYPYYAGPIEAVLARQPGIRQAYVVGTPDEQTGEAVHAFVVPGWGHTPSDAVLRDAVRTRLGEGSVPKTITYLAAVPVAHSGKPDKRALRASLR
ncbi:class I adenylate-forming enzyme family protein [Actinophytocola sp.]|uniref:class I adenylate-forming enzyme family protein n=1 Tax=Actinophytocola sp. TaxID=1872138 RepID=UPI002ED57B79